MERVRRTFSPSGWLFSTSWPPKISICWTVRLVWAVRYFLQSAAFLCGEGPRPWLFDSWSPSGDFPQIIFHVYCDENTCIQCSFTWPYLLPRIFFSYLVTISKKEREHIWFECPSYIFKFSDSKISQVLLVLIVQIKLFVLSWALTARHTSVYLKKIMIVWTFWASPSQGGKNVETSGGIIGFKNKTSSWHLIGFPNGSIGSAV